MADAMLDLIGAKERLVIEGRFAACEIFVRALASLRPETEVRTSGAGDEVSSGALRAIWPDLGAAAELEEVSPLGKDLAAYREKWRDQIDTFA